MSLIEYLTLGSAIWLTTARMACIGIRFRSLTLGTLIASTVSLQYDLFGSLKAQFVHGHFSTTGYKRQRRA